MIIFLLILTVHIPFIRLVVPYYKDRLNIAAHILISHQRGQIAFFYGICSKSGGGGRLLFYLKGMINSDLIGILDQIDLLLIE